jgi:hypothetical protein
MMRQRRTRGRKKMETHISSRRFVSVGLACGGVPERAWTTASMTRVADAARHRRKSTRALNECVSAIEYISTADSKS